MIIRNLNHMETIDESKQVQGQGYFTYFQNDFASLDLNTDINLEDNSAVVEGNSQAYGENSFSKVSFNTYADDGKSISTVNAFSASDDSYYYV